MKTLLITLIAAIPLTHAVQARDWAWFHGDIGTASPFVSSSSPTNKGTTRIGTAKKVVNEPKASPASHRTVEESKFKSTNHRVTAR